ncbi:MAG: hypothetical protein Q4D85_07065 [Corynebacterium sp.]|uniref:hypothetical protein n=1 Tax=Corynebacterium sp. TaxID=1720 RepID=UPI0026DBA16A|nr:hypothetical protein [Corynebacterium sp.]MDO5098506.1 hypothetical protein [Corynebacterium sp.]
MPHTPTTDNALTIFNNLGWNNATLADTPTLPLGNLEQQETARRDLTNTHIDFRNHNLVIFATRLGIPPRRVIEIASQIPSDVLATVITEHGDEYCHKFITVACTGGSRIGEHGVSWFGTAAVDALLRLAVTDPDVVVPALSNAEYVKDWAVVAARSLQPDAVTAVPRKHEQVVPQELITSTLARHVRAGFELGLAATGPFSTVVSAGYRGGWLGREETIMHICQALSMVNRPGDVKRWVQCLTEDIEIADAEIYAQRQLLSACIATGQPVVVEKLGVPLISTVTDSELVDIALPALYTKTKKAQKLVIAALKNRVNPAPETVQPLVERLREVPEGSSLLEQWGIVSGTSATSSHDAPTFIWRDAPPLWDVPRFAPIPATTEQIAQALPQVIASQRALSTTRGSFGDGTTEKFVLACHRLAATDPQSLRRVVAGVPAELFDGILRQWADDCLEIPRSFRKLSLVDARLIALLSAANQLPCVLSEPSYEDLSITFDDFLTRLKLYETHNQPVAEADLATALARLIIPESVMELPELEIRVMNLSGEILHPTVGTVLKNYLADSFTEPALDYQQPEVKKRPKSLRTEPDGIAPNYFFYATPQLFPCWQYAHLGGLHAHSPAAPIIANQLACRATELHPAATINFIGSCRSHPEIIDTLHTAWQRGLINIATMDATYLDWKPELTHLQALATTLMDIAEADMVALSWSALDAVITKAVTTHSRIPAGLTDIIDAMATLCPSVKAAVADATAPQTVLAVPGLRALAAKTGNAKAIVAARNVVDTLGPITTDDSPTPQASHLDDTQCGQLWSPPEAPDITDSLVVGISESGVITLGFPADLATYYHIRSVPTLGAVVLDQSYPSTSKTQRKTGSFIYWDGEAIQHEPAKQFNGFLYHKNTGTPKSLPPSLVAIYLAEQGTETWNDETWQLLSTLATTGGIAVSAVQNAVRICSQHPAWNPAILAEKTVHNPKLVPVFWPLLLEALPAANPRNTNRILEVIATSHTTLMEATRRGLIPLSSWDGVRQLALNGTPKNKAKAQELVAALPPA